MKALPLEATHRKRGARFGPVGDWRLPLDYGDPDGEQRGVRTAVGVIDASAKGKMRVEGPDRLAFLDGLLTNDLKTLSPGGGLYAATLDHRGRVHGDMVVYALEDHYLIATEPEAGDRVLAYLNRLLVSDDVTMTDVTDAFAVFGVYGPRSGEVVRGVAGTLPPTNAYAHVGGPGGRLVARSPAFGGEGYELWAPAAEADGLLHGLLDHGAVPFGHTAAEAHRIEAGRPKFPLDMNEDTIAVEARLESAISMTKGCYVGQEVVSRATYVGHVNRTLVGLEIDGTAVPPGGAGIAANGKPVGHVTSVARSATLGKTVGLGYIRREASGPGTEVTVDGAPARVAALPFVR